MPRKHGAHIKQGIIIIIIQRRRREKMVGRTRENGRGTINSRPKIKPRKGGSKKLNDVMEVVVFVWLCCWPVRNCCPCAKKKRYLHFWPYWNWKMMSFTLILKNSFLIRFVEFRSVGGCGAPNRHAKEASNNNKTRQSGSFIKRGFGYIKKRMLRL